MAANADGQASLGTYVQAIGEARSALEHVKGHGTAADGAATQELLRIAIEAARDAGVTWMQIGDLLGIARGNAYQRYRRRPTRSGDIRIA